MRQTITFDKFIRWALIALAVLTVGFIINELSEVLLPFFIAWLLAYLLYPIVKFVQYKLHVPGRALSIIVTLLFVIAIFACYLLFHCSANDRPSRSIHAHSQSLSKRDDSHKQCIDNGAAVDKRRTNMKSNDT